MRERPKETQQFVVHAIVVFVASLGFGVFNDNGLAAFVMAACYASAVCSYVIASAPGQRIANDELFEDRMFIGVSHAGALAGILGGCLLSGVGVGIGHLAHDVIGGLL